MQKQGEKPKPAKGATTFWRAADASKDYPKTQLQPFGWSSLGKMTDAIDESIKKIAEEKP